MGKGIERIEYKVKKSSKMIEVEDQFNESLEDLIHRLYWEEGKTVLDIADELGITQPTLSSWMQKLRIPTTRHTKPYRRRGK